MNRLIQGDCAQVLPTFQKNIYDSLLADPPASINFMGQAWDGDRGGKREYCAQHGIEYLVLQRRPAPGLPGRSSTVLRGF